MTQIKIDGAGNKFQPEDETASHRAANGATPERAENSSAYPHSSFAEYEGSAAGSESDGKFFSGSANAKNANPEKPSDHVSPVDSGSREQVAPIQTDPISRDADRDTPQQVQPSFQSTTRSSAAEVTNEVLIANVGDQPTLEDTLGFRPYVDAIASFLMNEVTKPPLTLSIEGEWGSGKSSFMLQLEQELRARNASVVRFNAWRHDKDDAMWAAFAMEFTRNLSRELPWFSRWRAHFRLFFQRFDWEHGWPDVTRLLLMSIGLLCIGSLPILMWDRIVVFVSASDSAGKSLGSTLSRIVGAGGTFGYLGLIALLIYKLKDVLGNPLTINLKEHLNTPDYRTRVAFIERFHQDFAKVVDVYGKNSKVCVFIDDLDRCEVPKAADLMQALNLMISDNSQLIFIMGMDREKVAAGLAVKYEKLLPYLASATAGSDARGVAAFDPVLGLEYGYGFIEKFIQLPFVVPQASEDQMKDFLDRVFSKGNERLPTRTASVPPKRTPGGKEAEKAVTQDSEMVSDILKMIAPTFEYNPRRMKQFINAFRLKTFIASRTGLFETSANPGKYDLLTTYQLGKFVALCLKWPLLLADVDYERDLLSRMQKLVLARIEPEDLAQKRQITVPVTTKGPEVLMITEALVRWYRRNNLREFLRVGLFTSDGNFLDEEIRRIYSLERLDVNKLLQVSPVRKPMVAANTLPAGPGAHNQNTSPIDTSATYPKVYGIK